MGFAYVSGHKCSAEVAVLETEHAVKFEALEALLLEVVLYVA